MAKLSRRGFFRALAATALVAVASSTRLAETRIRSREMTPEEIELVGRKYSEALARSMLETKESLAAGILNRLFDEGG